MAIPKRSPRYGLLKEDLFVRKTPIFPLESWDIDTSLIDSTTMCQPMCTGHCTVLCTALYSALSNVLCSALSSVMYSALLYSALLYRALHNGGGEARKLILFPGCVADSHLLGAQDVLCFPSICILRAVLTLWCFYTKHSYNYLADVYRWKHISPSLCLTQPGTIFGMYVWFSFDFYRVFALSYIQCFEFKHLV